MSKGPKNVLTGVEKMQLAIWGGQNKEKLTGLTKDQAAGVIEKELKFLPTAKAVKELYDVLGIRPVGFRTRSKVAAAASAPGKNHLKIRLLARILKNLFIELGSAVPPNLEAICLGKPLSADVETALAKPE